MWPGQISKTNFAGPAERPIIIEKYGWDERESKAGEKFFFVQTCNNRKIEVISAHRVFVPTFIKPCLIIIASRKALAHCLWPADIYVRSLDILGREVITATKLRTRK